MTIKLTARSSLKNILYGLLYWNIYDNDTLILLAQYSIQLSFFNLPCWCVTLHGGELFDKLRGHLGEMLQDFHVSAEETRLVVAHALLLAEAGNELVHLLQVMSW